MPAAEFVSRSAPSRARLRAHNSDAREEGWESSVHLNATTSHLQRRREWRYL